MPMMNFDANQRSRLKELPSSVSSTALPVPDGGTAYSVEVDPVSTNPPARPRQLDAW